MSGERKSIADLEWLNAGELETLRAAGVETVFIERCGGSEISVIAEGPSRRGSFGREVGLKVIGRGYAWINGDPRSATAAAIRECVTQITLDRECAQIEGRYFL